jgi:hypothetical protein
MILTSNRGFAEWGEIFGDPVVATALLDRLLHHAPVRLGLTEPPRVSAMLFWAFGVGSCDANSLLHFA